MKLAEALINRGNCQRVQGTGLKNPGNELEG